MTRRLLIALACAPHLLLAQPSTLDPTFSDDGLLITDVSIYDDEVHGLHVLPDGRILGVGWIDDGSNVFSFAQRLLPDGELDVSFGLGGTQLLPVAGQVPYAYAVDVQSDGRIIIAGLIYDGSFDGNAMVMRLLPDGEVDDSFGVDGLLSLDFGAPFGFQSAWAMQVMNDDRIVLVGEEGENGIACVRLAADGAYDATFGTNGLALTGVPFGSGLCLHVNDDGSVLAGGYRLEGGSDLLLARFDQSGVLHPLFGTGGIALLDLGGGDTEFMRGIDVLPDGRIAICGSRSFSGLDDEPIVALFTAEGEPDPSFDGDGLLLLPYATPQWGQARAILAQPDGKLLVSGFRAQTGGTANNDFFLFRLLDEGSFDPAFAGNGQVHTEVSGSIDRAFAMALAPNGEVVLAGFGSTNGRASAYTRYLNDIGTGVLMRTRTDEVRVWPNPASAQFTVGAGAMRPPVDLRLFTVDGREVYAARVSAWCDSDALTVTLPASVGTGNYVLRIEGSEWIARAALTIVR